MPFARIFQERKRDIYNCNNKGSALDPLKSQQNGGSKIRHQKIENSEPEIKTEASTEPLGAISTTN